MPTGSAGNQASILTIRSPLSGEIRAVHRISVRVYADPDKKPGEHPTFAFEYRSKDDPLLEKELFRQLQAAMEARGLKRQEPDAQIVVRLDFTVKPADGNQVLRYLQMNFLDRAELKSGKELPVPPVIWKGEAASVGQESDIRSVAPFMFREVLREFPTRSGRGEQRAVYCSNVGDTGIDVDRRDWHVIRAVRPGSPAALAGVTAGDWLDKIDDATVSWRMTYRPEKEEYAFKRANYVEGDYLYIRWTKNSGSRMVFKLKGPDGKTRTVKIALDIVDPCAPPAGH
jgi:hypothetical protein